MLKHADRDADAPHPCGVKMQEATRDEGIWKKDLRVRGGIRAT